MRVAEEDEQEWKREVDEDGRECTVRIRVCVQLGVREVAEGVAEGCWMGGWMDDVLGSLSENS
jgi:hypothetical protein